MEKIVNRLVQIICILMPVVFLPVLFCVFFIGNHMDYFDGYKLDTLLPNPVLALTACAGIAIWMAVFMRCRKEPDKRTNRMINGILIILFIILYFVNIKIARETAFMIPWDVSVVRDMAYRIADGETLGYKYYISMYSNNIPISYILAKIYKKVSEIENYPYITDFAWIQINCALISVAGYFSCLAVKKLTRKWMPVIVTFLLYLVLAVISPWKIAPYTDTYGMIFPILCIYFYVCYRDAEKTWQKFLWIFLSLISGGIGGFIKPSAYVVLIAVLGTEFVFFLTDYRLKWKYLLLQVILTIGLLAGSGICFDHIVEEIGLDFNPEIEMSWHHYFMMGLNEETTGSYSIADAGFIGAYQDSKSERNKAELEEAVRRLKDRGPIGSIYFWLRKLVMVFNDGTFGWRSEVWIADYYPDDLASDTEFTSYLRDIFWNEMPNMGKYNTLCQLAWMFCMLGIPGICFSKKGDLQKYLVFIVSFLGIFFYQMLFEARPRYLFVFLPVLVVISICGIQQYADRIAEKFPRLWNEQGGSE